MSHKNHWDFSEQAVKGSLLQEKLKPTFDLGFANRKTRKNTAHPVS